MRRRQGQKTPTESLSEFLGKYQPSLIAGRVSPAYLLFMPDCARPTLEILIADDSKDICTRLASLLSQLSRVSVVGIARNGQEALAQARSLRPDVLILDLRMPRINGLGVLKALRQEGNRLFAIVLTNYDDPIYRERAFQAGADRFLCKTTQMGQLEQVVRDLTSDARE